jgi:hypothetical protein
MNFVLVNGRSPSPQSFCALCCEPIGWRYLREIATRLCYCDHKCYVGHCKYTVTAKLPSQDRPAPGPLFNSRTTPAWLWRRSP